MTAFNKNDLPDSIITLEQLHVWSGLALEDINSDLTAVEGSGPASAVADTGIFDVTQTKTTRVITRTSFELNKGFTYSGKKLWEEIKELSSTALPDGFKNAA